MGKGLQITYCLRTVFVIEKYTYISGRRGEIFHGDNFQPVGKRGVSGGKLSRGNLALKILPEFLCAILFICLNLFLHTKYNM